MKRIHSRNSWKEEIIVCNEGSCWNRNWSNGKKRYIKFCSECASPIVIVPKPDEIFRICVDYKRTFNPVIKNDAHPQPTPEELFSKIQGGERFSKIHLTKAYLQVELDDKSQKYLTINTSKGLKQPTRMPYGVKPATGIFQRLTENTLYPIHSR